MRTPGAMALGHPGRGLAGLRIGYLKAAFDTDHATKTFDAQALDVFKGLGVALIPIEIPTDVPPGPLRIILAAEAAAAIDEVTRSNRDDQMVQQTRDGEGGLIAAAEAYQGATDFHGKHPPKFS